MTQRPMKKKSGPSAPLETSPKGSLPIDASAIRVLSDLFKETDLTEIEYEINGCRIRLARTGPSYGPMPTFSMAMPQASSAPTAAPVVCPAPSHDPADHPGVVKSPMVGTAYLSPKPGAPKFIEIGTTVAEGQTILIIEAMKVMNPLKSPRAGRISQVLIDNGSPVEFDQPLLIIDPC